MGLDIYVGEADSMQCSAAQGASVVSYTDQPAVRSRFWEDEGRLELSFTCIYYVKDIIEGFVMCSNLTKQIHYSGENVILV